MTLEDTLNTNFITTKCLVTGFTLDISSES